eukprot:2034136-Pyramimonas_sp.AAC.1
MPAHVLVCLGEVEQDRGACLIADRSPLACGSLSPRTGFAALSLGAEDVAALVLVCPSGARGRSQPSRERSR